MTEQRAITCVIPTHDRPELLQQAIASVVAQKTDRTFDVIVVDDLGGQATADVVDEANRESPVRIRYLARSGNKGASASRNFVLAVESGELLAFLDDDDLWEETFLERAVDVLEQTGADMAVTWLTVLHLDGSRAPLFEIDGNLSASAVAAWNVGYTGSNFVIRKGAFEALGGFDPNLPVSNDKDFFLRFLLAGLRYAVVPEYLAVHRRHPGPQLTTGDERRAAGVEAYLLKHSSVMTWGGRRHLRKRIHRIRLHTSPTRLQRLLHTIAFVANLSIADVKSKWRRRDGRYTAIR